MGVPVAGKGQALSEFAHPADLSGWHSHHEGVVGNVAIDDCASAHKGMGANGHSTNNRAVGAQRGTAPDQCRAVLAFSFNGRPGVVDVGEDGARATEHVVLEHHAFVQRHVVLYLAVMTNHDLARDEDALAD